MAELPSEIVAMLAKMRGLAAATRGKGMATSVTGLQLKVMLALIDQQQTRIVELEASQTPPEPCTGPVWCDDLVRPVQILAGLLEGDGKPTVVDQLAHWARVNKTVLTLEQRDAVTRALAGG